MPGGGQQQAHLQPQGSRPCSAPSCPAAPGQPRCRLVSQLQCHHLGDGDAAATARLREPGASRGPLPPGPTDPPGPRLSQGRLGLGSPSSQPESGGVPSPPWVHWLQGPTLGCTEPLPTASQEAARKRYCSGQGWEALPMVLLTGQATALGSHLPQVAHQGSSCDPGLGAEVALVLPPPPLGPARSSFHFLPRRRRVTAPAWHVQGLPGWGPPSSVSHS